MISLSVLPLVGTALEEDLNLPYHSNICVTICSQRKPQHESLVTMRAEYVGSKYFNLLALNMTVYVNLNHPVTNLNVGHCFFSLVCSVPAHFPKWTFQLCHHTFPICTFQLMGHKIQIVMNMNFFKKTHHGKSLPRIDATL